MRGQRRRAVSGTGSPCRVRGDAGDPASKDRGAPAGEGVAARERAMARQLVAALSGPFVPADFKDTSRARVLALIEAKARGRRTTVHKFRPKKPAGKDLSQLLQASLKDARKKQKAG